MKSMLAIAGAVLLTAWTAAANDDVVVEPSLEERFARIEAELADLQQGDYGGVNAAECCPKPCCCQCPPTGFFGGAEVVVARPHLKESFDASIVNLAGVQTLVPTDFDYSATPRVWLGYVGPNRLGVRARYWELDESSGPQTFLADGFNFPGAQNVAIIFPSAISTDFPGESLVVSSGIELQTFELEGTYHFNAFGNSIVASGGISYARIAQDYQSAVFAGGVREQVLTWDRQIEGVGPSVGIELRRPMGGGLQFFSGTHLATLFGEKDIHRIAVGPIAAGPFQTIPSTNFDGGDELLVTAQLQLGLEWSQPIACGGDLFARASYEGQLFTDSGGNALGYLGVQGFGFGVGISR